VGTRLIMQDLSSDSWFAVHTAVSIGQMLPGGRVVQNLLRRAFHDSCVTCRAPECRRTQQHGKRVYMAEQKLTNSELIKLRRSVALRELELAAFYPQTSTGITLLRKRAERAILDEKPGKKKP
jgi:hypothetical protein